MGFYFSILNNCVSLFQKLEQNMPCLCCLPLHVDYHAELVDMRTSKWHVLAVSI